MKACCYDNIDNDCKHQMKLYFFKPKFSITSSTAWTSSMALPLQLCHLLWICWPLDALTRNVRCNVCNEMCAAHIQSTWRLAEAESIIIYRNNIKLFHFTISGERETVFLFSFFSFLTYISRICLDSAAAWTNERCHATTFPRVNFP